jgi:hypothetical protein
MATSPNPFDQFDAPAGNPFDQFDPAPAGQQEQPSLLHTLIRKLVGAGDLGIAGLSQNTVGLTTPLAGLAARATGHDPAEWKAAYDRAMVYHPQTPEGQAMDHAADPVTVPIQNAIGKGVQATDTAIGNVAGPYVQNAVRGGAGLASDLVAVAPVAGVVGKGIAGMADAAAARAANSAVARTPDEVARAAGFRVRPSDVQDATGVADQPSLTARATQAVGGGHQSQVEMIRHNKPQVNRIGTQDIGLKPDTQVTDDAITAAKKPFAAVYDQVRKDVPYTNFDQQFVKDAANAGRANESVLPLPAAAEKVKEEILSRPGMTGGQLIDTISDLRAKGWKGLASDDPDIAATGQTCLSLADALDDQLARATDSVAPGLGLKYRDARVGFAKVQAVENARVGLDIDPKALARADRKTYGMDGGLKVIADTATAFPKVMSVTVPEASDTAQAVHTLTAFGTAGVKPGIQKLARMLLNGTRGEADALDASKLSYYFRDKPTDTRSPFPDRPPIRPDSGRILPGPGQVSIDLPNEGLNAADLADGPYGHPSEVGRMSGYRRLALPAPGQTADIPSVSQMLNEGLNPADRGAGPYGHPGEPSYRAPVLMLPGPGQTSARTLAEGLVRPQAATNHPAAPMNPIPSTLTKAEKKKVLDHLVQALQYRIKTGEINVP